VRTRPTGERQAMTTDEVKRKPPNYRLLILAACGIVAFAVYGGDKAAPAPPVTSKSVDFSARDIRTIVDASRTNEPRFNRDYKGKVFSAVLPFQSISEKTFGGYQVNMVGAYCFPNDQAMVHRMIEWRSGHSAKITGTIHSTMFGDIWLDDNCVIAE
jgi:hypothetical protein